jgi:hypothetical protein
MRTTLHYILIFTAILTSCEKFNSDPDLIFQIGDDLKYTYHDFELYDSSTHILYFRKYHPEFEDLEQTTFAFYTNDEKIFEGVFWPGYSCSFPSGPFISIMPSFYQNYALRFEYMFSNDAEVLNDPRLINALKNNGLLHSGISVRIDKIEIIETHLYFSFTVNNYDQTSLLILDPDKMGAGLFHYFTNGLSISTADYDEVFSSSIVYQTPEPWNSWKIGWLSELKSGESRQFTINYSTDTPVDPGEYKAFFEFPGLSFQITKDQLYQGARRIWLGDILAAKNIIIP